MKYILPTVLMLFSLGVIATGGGPEANRTMKKRQENVRAEKHPDGNSVQAGVNTGTGASNTEKDIRIPEEKVNKDYSDTDLETDDE
jgi:hypothetical protein